MIAYQPRRDTALHYTVDFHDFPYSNISFFDAEGCEILFHLSLRQSEGLAVCNEYRNGAWGREVHQRVDFGESSCRVSICFQDKGLCVALNGREVFNFQKRFRKVRYAEWRGIRQIDFQGALNPGSFSQSRIGRAEARSSRVPRLTERLELVVDLDTDDVPRGASVLRAISGEEFEAIVEDRAGGGIRLRTVLPGWVWKELTRTEGKLTFEFAQADVGAATSEPISIAAETVAEVIAREFGRLDWRLDSFGTMQALEHILYGQLMSRLPSEVRKDVGEAIVFYELESVFAQNAQGHVAPAQTDLAQTSDFDPGLGELLARFHQSVSRGSGADPIDALKSILPSDPDLRRALFVSLSDFFCREGQDYPSFHALAGEVTRDLKGRNDIWFDSAILPFVLSSGRQEEALELVRGLVDPRPGWLVTPALGWLARELSRPGAVPEPLRGDILAALLDIIRARAAEYFERTYCLELTRGLACLVRSCESFKDASQASILELAVEHYALSPAFWQSLEGVALPGELTRVHELWLAWRQAGSDPERFAALASLARLRVKDAPRYARESVAPQHRLSELSENRPLAGLSDGDEALRGMAHPFGGSESTEIHRLASQTHRLRYTDVPPNPFASDLEKLARLARRIEQVPESADAELESFIGLASALLSEDAERVGARMALGLALSLRNAGYSKLAKTLEQFASRDADAPSGFLQARLKGGGEWTFGDTLVSDEPSFVFDTLVLVFSCKPFLDTRIPEMRRGWLSDLKALGVPYLVVVGDGDGSIEGDVLRLAADDSYEGLPEKTLAAIEWAYENTPYAHVMKIDDDCFLNAREFFFTHTYRKHDYYGRALTRVQGQMDRTWHCAKSSKRHAQLEFDKSPEPSTYADGGCGWTLSRRAMRAVQQAKMSLEGQLLARTSFMEDKLLGDLLALERITLSSEDFLTTVRRRAHSGAIPVARWVNGFDASQIAQVKVTHLDASAPQSTASKRLTAPVLRPAKIWPGFQKARLGYQSNALELVSSEARLARVAEAPVAVVSCLRNELFILPRFLDHYRRLGAGGFMIADNFSNDGTLEYLSEQEDVALFSVDTDYNLSSYGVAWQQALLAEFRRGKWSVVADADEFLFWQQEQRESLADLLAKPQFEQADAARIFMLDMYPEGPLSDATFEAASPFEEAAFVDREPFLTNWPGRGPFSDQPTWTSAVRHRLIAGARPDLFVAQKLALLKYQPWMRLSAGLHFVAETQLATQELFFGHFKYNADFLRKAATEVARRQHFNNAEEYRKYLHVVSEGRAHVFDARVSVRWQDCAFVKERLVP